MVPTQTGPPSSQGPLAEAPAGSSGQTPSRPFEPLCELLSWTFPVHCFGCREPLPRPPPLGLCIRCRGRLKRLDDRAGQPAPPALDRLLGAWSYEPPLDAVIQALKFQRLDFLGRPLGREAAELLGMRTEGFDCLVPVPLHWRRRWTRGFNQAELIAHGIADLRRLPVRRLLRRVRSTPAQSGLPRRDRLRGPRGAFRCSKLEPPRPLAALLVDDVATTGATLEAAAVCLRQSGVRRVSAVVLGQTPVATAEGVR